MNEPIDLGFSILDLSKILLYEFGVTILNQNMAKKAKLFYMNTGSFIIHIKGALSGLRQFLAAESPLKMMTNAFYFTSKALFILKVFNFLS